MNKTSLGWKIFGFFFSILLIIGGLSGEFVLRGTNSSEALVVAGFLFLIWDIISIATHKKQQATPESDVSADVVPQGAESAQGAEPLPAALHEEGMLHARQSPDRWSSPPPPPEYKGIQWYIEVLRQYANFSGRARRKEYWMFVLFNMIFSFVWSFILSLVMILARGNNPLIIYAFSVAMMLPSLAVAVRRLHDIGKSGWMMFVSLIPIVGGFWLLILLATDGQPHVNKYGPNPKTTPVKFGEKAKLKSAGVTWMVAAVAALIITIVSIISMDNPGYFILHAPMRLAGFIAQLVLFSASVFLLKENRIYPLQRNGKNAMILVLVSFSVFLVTHCINLFQMIRFEAPLMSIISISSFPPFLIT